MAKRWAIYDHDADEMATTNVYRTYEDVVRDANDLNNSLIVCLGDVAPDPDVVRLLLAAHTNTDAEDWDPFDGPETGVGVEQWYANDRTGQQAYTCTDGNKFTVEVTDGSSG